MNVPKRHVVLDVQRIKHLGQWCVTCSCVHESYDATKSEAVQWHRDHVDFAKKGKQFHDLPENLHSGVVEIGNQPTPTDRETPVVDKCWCGLDRILCLHPLPIPSRAKLAQPEEPRCTDGTVYHIWLNKKCVECGISMSADPTPARVEQLIQPSLEDYQRADDILRIASAWKQTKGSLIQLLHRAYANQAFLQRTQRVEQPASEGGGARYGYMRHVGNWQCIRCEQQVPYDPNWSVMAEAIGKHYAESHPTPPATAAPVGDVEQAELPPLDVTDDEMRRAKYVLVGIGEDCAKAERFCRERQLRAEIAAHKATREELDARNARGTGFAYVPKAQYDAKVAKLETELATMSEEREKALIMIKDWWAHPSAHSNPVGPMLREAIALLTAKEGQ